MDRTRPATCPSAFWTLPLEIRELIYNFHLQSTPHLDRGSPPSEPPLTLACKQIRREALPLYYSAYKLHVQTFIRSSYHRQIWLRTEHWYHGIAPAKFKQIRHLQLNFALIDPYTGERVPVEFHVDLPKRGGCFAIRQSFARSWIRNPHRIGDPADFDELIVVLRDHLDGVLSTTSKQGRIVEGLSAEDVDRLVKIDPDSLPLFTQIQS